MGALDTALWDIKGKALGAPVYELLGGLSREHIECYSGAFTSAGTLQERARAVIEAGFRAFRTAIDMPWSSQPGDHPAGVFTSRQAIDQEVEKARQIREGVGKDGDWLTDVHTRLDLSDSVRLCALLEPFAPLEAPLSSPLPAEAPIAISGSTRRLFWLQAVQLGDRSLQIASTESQERLIDYARVTIPSTGGITEFMRRSPLCARLTA